MMKLDKQEYMDWAKEDDDKNIWSRGGGQVDLGTEDKAEFLVVATDRQGFQASSHICQ